MKKCNGYIPARLVLVALGFFGFFNVYAMRVNLSVAIVAMVKQANNSALQNSTEGAISCPHLKGNTQNKTSLKSPDLSRGEFEWNSREQGLVLSAFFYGYVVTQIPGGIMAEKFGAKWVFGIGMMLSSVFTLLTPVAARWSIWALVVARVIEGIGQGVVFPAINTLIGQWSPQMERSRMSSFIFAGFQIGTVVSLAVSGLLSDSSFLGGWPSVFYVFGFLGCLWLIIWMILIYESPEDHPRISEDELIYISRGKEQSEHKIKRRPFPWKAAITSAPVWAVTITHLGQNWGFYTILIQTPMYLSNVLHFDLKQNGSLSALPNLVLFAVTILASVITDKLRSTGRWKITTIRKINQSIGTLGPAACLVAIAYAGCRPIVIVFLLALAMGLMGFSQSGYMVTHVDMSPDFAGSLMGISNCIANFAGFLVPVYVGRIIQDGQTMENWAVIFLTSAGVLIFVALVYGVFGSAELQPWGACAGPSASEKRLDNCRDVLSLSENIIRVSR